MKQYLHKKQRNFRLPSDIKQTGFCLTLFLSSPFFFKLKSKQFQFDFTKNQNKMIFTSLTKAFEKQRISKF